MTADARVDALATKALARLAKLAARAAADSLRSACEKAAKPAG